MTDEPRNITPPDLATRERDDQTTEKSQAKPVESLQTSELRYRRLFESARDGILILDADSRQIADVNPYMIELLEYSREEFIGKELYEIGFLADKEASQKVYRELQESGYVRYEALPLETKSGKRWDVEFVCNVYDEGGQQVIQCNIRDITARKQAELLLRSLTAREVEILRLLALGYTNRDISELMFSISTIKNHVQNIFSKLDATDRTQAAVRAVELGLVDPET